MNQAVAVLHATGRPPEWLAQAVVLTNRATERLDAAADQNSCPLCRRPASHPPADTIDGQQTPRSGHLTVEVGGLVVTHRAGVHD